MLTSLMLLLIVAGLVLVPLFPLSGFACVYAGIGLYRLARFDEELFAAVIQAAGGAGALASVAQGLYLTLR
jgi:hypothetical protein